VSMDGRPFLGHVATATSTGSTKLHLKGTPGVPASSYPIKGQAGALQRTTNNGQRMTKHQSPSHHRISTSQAITFVLSTFL
jgi:hypothetical protein